jgi:hypothetical protein
MNFMAITFPTNTIALIVTAMLVTVSGSLFILAQGLRQLPVTPQSKRLWLWGAAIILVAWLATLLALALNPPSSTPLAASTVVTFLGAGMAAGLLPLFVSPTFRQIVRAIPPTWFVAMHITRILGFGFLALMDMKLLPAVFALPAGYGDMIVAVLALGVLYLHITRNRHARALTIAWNGLGLLDFVGALVTGVLYIGPFAAQLATAGASLSYLNYVLIVPSFGVPLYTLLHIYSLFQLLSARADRPTEKAEHMPLRHFA